MILGMPALVLLCCFPSELWLVALSLQQLPPATAVHVPPSGWCPLLSPVLSDPWRWRHSVSIPCRTSGQLQASQHPAPSTVHGAGASQPHCHKPPESSS